MAKESSCNTEIRKRQRIFQSDQNGEESQKLARQFKEEVVHNDHVKDFFERQIIYCLFKMHWASFLMKEAFHLIQHDFSKCGERIALFNLCTRRKITNMGVFFQKKKKV